MLTHFPEVTHLATPEPDCSSHLALFCPRLCSDLSGGPGSQERPRCPRGPGAAVPCVHMEVVRSPAYASARRSCQWAPQLLALFAASGTSGPSSVFVEGKASFLPAGLVSFLLSLLPAARVFLTHGGDWCVPQGEEEPGVQ